MKSIINITNGYYLNSYLQKKYPNKIFIPFNEAMIEGKPVYPIFSDEFIHERCLTHQVSKESYLENMKEFLNISKNINFYDSITLWFGKDMFCQLNLLTILAYFNQINVHKTIVLNLINEETYEMIEQVIVPNDDYLFIYKNLFIENQLTDCRLSDLNQTIHSYFNYENEIISFIKENSHLNKLDLLKLLLENTKKYGLGDTQIHKLIQKYKIN